METAVVLGVLGFAGGFLSGLLGLGGSIVMVPMLLFVPEWLGIGPYDMKTVAAMSTVQVFFAALAGAVVHRRRGRISRPLAAVMGVTAAVAGFAGAYLSKFADAGVLTLVFAVLSTAGLVLMFVPKKDREWSGPADEVPFNRWAAAGIAFVVGLAGGAVGAAGAFLFVPLMIYLLDIPTRVTVGSTLAVVLLTSSAALLGKGLSGQIPWTLSLALAAGSVPGAQLGARLSDRVPAAALRYAITALIAVATLRLWISALSVFHV